MVLRGSDITDEQELPSEPEQIIMRAVIFSIKIALTFVNIRIVSYFFLNFRNLDKFQAISVD